MIPVLTSAWPGLSLPGLALPGSAPSGLLVLAAITLTGMLVALLAHSARVAAAVTAIPQGQARLRPAREVLARRVPAPAGSGCRGPGPAPGAHGGPGGRLIIRLT